MPAAGPHGPAKRLVLTLAALAAVIGGYYLGQYWQRRPLADLTAVVYPADRTVEYPASLDLDRAPAADAPWRLFLVANSREPACQQLLRHYAIVFNRLAAWPRIQETLRLSVLAYDRPDAETITAFTGGVTWAEVVSAAPDRLDLLSAQLGIRPDPQTWCSPAAGNAVLVAPNGTRWALIPYEQAAMMARNIRTIIEFVE